MDKENLRQWARQIRSGISQSRRATDEALLWKNILFYFEQTTFPALLGVYYPVRGEIAPPHKIDGVDMALPVIRGGKTLEFYRWSLGDPMAVRDFEIPIPDTRHMEPVIPTHIIAPLLLCDRHGNRLGNGAGHFDRYMAGLTPKPVYIGVCFDEQIYQGALPAEPHDVKLDVIITPKETIEIQ